MSRVLWLLFSLVLAVAGALLLAGPHLDRFAPWRVATRSRRPEAGFTASSTRQAGRAPCAACGDSGWETITDWEWRDDRQSRLCLPCSGTGRVSRRNWLRDGQVERETCSQCSGLGSTSVRQRRQVPVDRRIRCRVCADPASAPNAKQPETQTKPPGPVATPLPDLVILGARFEAGRGPFGELVADVGNIGTAPVDDRSWAQGLIIVEGPGNGHAALRGLRPGERKQVRVPNTVLVDSPLTTARVVLTVDPGNTIPELDEHNNRSEPIVISVHR